MGFQLVVFGRIVLEQLPHQARAVIQSLGNEKGMLRTEMFGLGISEITYYWYPVISFGATYKETEGYWSAFILEFENILRQINFDTAKIQLETEIMGTYHFFWSSKKHHPGRSFDEEDKMIEVEEWFFGFGNRSRWGTLESDLTPCDIFDLDGFTYPVPSPLQTTS